MIEDIDQDVLAAEHGYETAARDLEVRLTGEPTASWERVGIRAALIEPPPLRLYVSDLVHELEHHLVDLIGAR